MTASKRFAVRTLTEADYEAVAPLVSELETTPVTGSALRQRDAANVDAIALQAVAVVDGTVVGYGRVSRMPYYTAGRFWCVVSVAREYRGHGMGRALLQTLESFARSNGGTYLASQAKEGSPGVPASERFGFHVTAKQFESSLELSHFDAQAYTSLFESLTREGIRFESFAETDRSEAAQRRIYEINRLLAPDVPGYEVFDWPFENFRRDVFQSPWFRAEGQILALVGEEPVGLGAVGETMPGQFYHHFTGVRHDFRGRGIACALKVRSIEAALRLGGARATTHNDSRNEPMLAINRKLGYVPTAGVLSLRLDLR